MKNNLVNQKVVSHEEMKLLSEQNVKEYLSQLKEGWVIDGNKIRKQFKFEDFVKAIEFVNKVAKVAQAQGHHPDIEIHYNKVDIILWSHFVSGLSINDFIMAAKIDQI